MTRPTRLVSLEGWPWYPTLIATSTVLAVLAEFPVQLGAGVRPLLVVIVVATAVTLLWVQALGLDRGGAAAAISLMALVGATSTIRLLAFVAAIALILVEAAWARRGTMRLRIPWVRLTYALNAVLVVFVGLQIGRAVLLRHQVAPLPVPAAWTASAGLPTPDIFLILPDGHGRLDVLAERYGYDSSEFAGALTAAGLSESPNSYANHSLTRYSLSVLLNGRPLSELGQDMAGPADDQNSYRVLLRSSGISMLEAAGYETTIISSGFDHLPLRDVDRYVDVGPNTELEQTLWGSWAIGKAVDGLVDTYPARSRTRVLGEAQALKDVAHRSDGRPQFVLAHLPSPHWPEVLSGDCSLRPRDAYTLGAIGRDGRAGDATAVRIAAEQTRCVDALLADAVREIVQARPNAIVIVLSDHGPEERLDFSAPDAAGTHDRMANLFWARTPGKPRLFPNDVTLVNVLPILANAYLGTNLPLHPNDLYLGPIDSSRRFTLYRPPDLRSR